MSVSDARLGAAMQAEAATAHYPVNIRVTIPFLPRRLFLTVIMGRERRGPARLREERLRHPLHTWGNLFTFALTSTVLTIAALFTAVVMTGL